MPSYYNPYNFYPATYMQPNIQQPIQSVQPQTAMSMQQAIKPMEWVEGEVGAKAYQMPQGLPANQPVPLWDSTDTNIFLKSWGPMGIPNPIQKLHYTMPEQNTPYLPGGTSGSEAPQPQQIDTSKFVTKDELEEMRNEVRSALNSVNRQNRSMAPSGNQNGSNGNRGGTP